MSSQGSIITHVYTSAALLPVEGAAVTISQTSPEGICELLSMQITDENGKTAPVIVETPDGSQSQEPGHERPFAVVDIIIECPLYERLFIASAQVFADTTTLQNAQLIPLDALPESLNQTESVNVVPQQL